MREIKFRAWNGEKFQYFGMGTFWHTSDLAIYHALVLDGVKFEQFTGLHDKNGKEIYEGDIVKCNPDKILVRYTNGQQEYKYPSTCYMDRGETCTIEYDDCHAGFLPFCDYDGDCYLFNSPSNFEIIGNIYENSELLEVK